MEFSTEKRAMLIMKRISKNTSETHEGIKLPHRDSIRILGAKENNK